MTITMHMMPSPNYRLLRLALNLTISTHLLLPKLRPLWSLPMHLHASPLLPTTQRHQRRDTTPHHNLSDQLTGHVVTLRNLPPPRLRLAAVTVGQGRQDRTHVVPALTLHLRLSQLGELLYCRSAKWATGQIVTECKLPTIDYNEKISSEHWTHMMALLNGFAAAEKWRFYTKVYLCKVALHITNTHCPRLWSSLFVVDALLLLLLYLHSSI